LSRRLENGDSIKVIAQRFIVFGVTANSEIHAQSDFKVTLLGTGTPGPSIDRFGPSTLVEAGNQKLLFDAGRGATIRLRQLNIPIARLDRLFITHFHSDHVVGIPDLWLTGLLPAGGSRMRPFEVSGPIGTQALMSGLEQAYAADLKMRAAFGYPKRGLEVSVSEFAKDGVAYEAGGVKVTAFEVDHGPQEKPAFGYRLDYGGRSVLISGDTRLNENLINHGQEVDLLIHEVAAARSELTTAPIMRAILAVHTSAHDAGEVSRRTRPKLAAYTHLVLLSTAQIPAPSIDQLVAQTRETYSGPLEVGEDLMTFEIGSMVTVRRFKP
jgi:ribonuclease Z